MLLKKWPKIIFIVCLSFAETTVAGDFRAGFAFGLGGTGVSATESLEGVSTKVQRSESPGIFHVFVDRFISENWNVGLDHTRGFRLAPFTSQISFTGLFAHYFFWGPAPIVGSFGEDSSILMIKRLTPFVGGGVGVASASTNRPEETIPSVDGSGIYMAFHFGFEYPFSQSMVLRPQLTGGTTISSAAAGNKASLSMFALQCGFVFPF